MLKTLVFIVMLVVLLHCVMCFPSRGADGAGGVVVLSDCGACESRSALTDLVEASVENNLNRIKRLLADGRCVRLRKGQVVQSVKRSGLGVKSFVFMGGDERWWTIAEGISNK